MEVGRRAGMEVRSSAPCHRHRHRHRHTDSHIHTYELYTPDIRIVPTGIHTYELSHTQDIRIVPTGISIVTFCRTLIDE